MTEDLILLASAYLDGEATPDERALVEADPTLLGEVERLRTARNALLDANGFERPSNETRESAIAAALTVWDFAALDPAGSVHASPPSVRRPVVVPFIRRNPYARWLSAAAAVVALVGLGVVVAQFDSSDDGDESASLEAAADTVAPGEATTEFAEQTEQTEQPADTADALLSGDVASDDAGAEVRSDVADSAEAPTAAPAGTAAAAATAIPEVSLETPEELGTFAVIAERDADSGQNRNDLIPSCAGEESDVIEYVATGTYRGQPVAIGIDDEGERAIAVDPVTCEIVAEAPLP